MNRRTGGGVNVPIETDHITRGASRAVHHEVNAARVKVTNEVGPVLNSAPARI